MRSILLIILVLVALSSTAAGVLLLYPAITIFDIRSVLAGLTPFSNFILSGSFLLITISASSLIACYWMCMKTNAQYKWTTITGVILSAVALLQVLLMRPAGPVHLGMAAAGTLIILISYQLRGKWAV